MSELSDILISLSASEQRMVALERERDELPRAVETEEAALADANAALEAERARLQQAEETRRAREGDLQEAETQRDKFRAQTSLVKTNAEYTALLHEIEGTERRIGEVEEAILLAMEEIDTVRGSLSEGEREHVETERAIKERIGAHRVRLEEVAREIEARRAEEQERLAKLQDSARAVYVRLKQRKGVATARVRELRCSVCHRDVPPERVNRMLAGELQLCANCERILVPGVETDEESA
jgi:predicted  nucleic acid-binding Zn-ribbon protein